MNIFDHYLDNIKKILLDLSNKGDLTLPENLDGISTEVPPSKFNSDISTNVAMVLSKIAKKSPLIIKISDHLKKDELVEEISIVKPCFINIRFKQFLDKFC